MISPAAAVDTNVVVSGLISSDPGSPPCRILDGMLRGRFIFLLSMDLLTEYREVLLRPKIRWAHGLDEQHVDRVLTEIAANGILRQPPVSGQEAPATADNHLWDLLVSDPGGVLVTGDQPLLNSPPAGASVVSPRRFLELPGDRS